jgi:NADH-quinone oxidoreductase subunit A
VVLSSYAVAGLVGLMALGLALLGAAVWHPAVGRVDLPPAWKARRFGYPIYALIFLSFDMEMIFMYPWAVVFASIGLDAFLEMFVFIAILSAGIAYAWGMGGLQWE